MTLSDAKWKVLGPLIEACRPHAKVRPANLRRTIGAILWRHENGAKWRAIPPDLGPWWMAARTFIRWAKSGVWDRLFDLARSEGVELGMAFLDGTNRPVAFRVGPGQSQNSRMPFPCSAACRASRAGSWPIVASPAMPSASMSGRWAHDPRSRRRATNRRCSVRRGSMLTGTASNGCGDGSRSGEQWRPDTRKLPVPSWASFASPPAWSGSGANRA